MGYDNNGYGGGQQYSNNLGGNQGYYNDSVYEGEAGNYISLFTFYIFYFLVDFSKYTNKGNMGMGYKPINKFSQLDDRPEELLP